MKKKMFEIKWANTVLRYPILITFASLVIVALMAYGGRYTTISSDYRYFFGETNPQRTAFEKLQSVYSKDDSVLMTITPKTGNVFNKQTLAGLVDLTEKAWKLPFVTRVDSISNFQYSFAEGDDLVVRDLISSEILKSAKTKDLVQISKIALAEPLLINQLINQDASVTAVNLRMNFPGKSPFEVPEAAEAARNLAKQFTQDYPGHVVHLTGMVMLNDAFNEAGIRDVMTLIPIMYLLITIIVFFVLRSFAGVFTTLTVVFLSILGGVGFAGWAGIPITPPSSIAPTVIMTLAIANSIHILKTFFKVLGLGNSKVDAIIESLKLNLRPVFLTSLTTIIGFLSLNFSDTPPFQDLGNITAIGVAFAFILSVALLPAMMRLLPIKAVKTKKTQTDISSRYSSWLIKRGVIIALATVFFTAFLGMQIPKIHVNDQFVGYFDKSIQFRPDSEYTIQNLTGIYDMNFDMDSGQSQGITDPQFLRSIDEFANFMRTIPGVVHVSTISDTFKKLSKNMNGDDESFYRLPQRQDLAAQYLLLYEMSLPYGLDLNSKINVDKSSTKVRVTLDEVPTSRILEITQQASQWLKVHAPDLLTTGTSPTVMFSHITKRNIDSMLWGTIIAFTLITLIMIIALGSVKYGLISLLPNLIPATLAIGVWSLLVGEAGFSIAFVASVTLGIIVDDTVHFLSKFNFAKREGRSTEESIHYAFQNVGSALISTSIILVIGFSVLMFSGFKLNFVLGALSALTIAIALLVDFTFLPVILRLSDKLSFNLGGKMKLKYATYTTLAVIAAVGLSLSFNVNANPKDSKQKGLWVATQADEYDSGFINQTSKVTMVLKNEHGQEARRELRIKILEVKNDGDKSLTTFDTPRDVKGTSFLSFSHSNTPDEQWLYLPAMKRVKRISSNNKSGPFMGSEFAYEDLSSQEVDKYQYSYIKQEQVLGEPGHVFERYPVDKKSGYTKQVVWLDSTHWRVAKIDYYDRKGQLLKTLSYSDYKQYPNGKWRADVMTMVNHQSRKSTSLYWKDIQFGVNISSRDFDKNTLKRIR